MTLPVEQVKRNTFPGGVHPPEHKELAADSAIEVFPVPDKVIVPMLQHLGAECEPVVEPRQAVEAGDVLGTSEAFISAPVHSPVSGETAKAGAVTLPTGRRVRAVPVKAGENNSSGDELIGGLLGGQWAVSELERYSPEDISSTAKEKGLVGMGGAGFPTCVKLIKNEDRPVNALVVNGCECEPYLTADYRLMLEYPSPVVSGALLAARGCGAGRIMIVVEDNKLLAVESLKEAADGTGIEVLAVCTRYPQGGEKQLVKTALGRKVPDRGLPLDVGVVVINVGTAAALAAAVLRDRPLTHRVVSVTGHGIRRPANIFAPVGVSIGEVIEYCGGLMPDAVRVIAGGPMMGFAIGDLGTPITKTTSGITVLTESEVKTASELNCLRCGKCVDVCPMDLVPTRLAIASRANNWDIVKKYHIDSCMECGCCGYVCPSSIPLVQLIRMGKAMKPRN